jgi:tetratricopeptide (TPR) repeat protein
MRLIARFYFALLFIASASFSAQVSVKDSMEVTSLYHSAEILLNRRSFDSALLVYDKALHLTEKIKWTNGIANALKAKWAVHFYYMENADSAEVYLKRLESFAQKSEPFVTRMVKRMRGATFSRDAKYEDAMRCFYDALTISEKLNNKKFIASDNHAIGVEKANLKNHAEGLPHCLLALEINRELRDTQAMLSNLYVIGNLYSQVDPPKGKVYHEERLRICLARKDDDCIYPTYAELSGFYLDEGNPEKALEYALNAYHYFKKVNAIQEISNTLGKVCHYLSVLKRDKEAYPYLVEMREMAAKSHDKYLLVVNTLAFARYYEKIGEYDKSCRFYDRHYTMYDSVFKASSAEQMAEMSKKYESEKKDKELAQQKIEIQEQQADSREKSMQRNIFIIAFAAMALLVFAVFRSYNQKKKANAEISKQKDIIEEKQKEILDSIRYAKRIQQALITSERYVERNLDRLKKDD